MENDRPDIDELWDRYQTPYSDDPIVVEEMREVLAYVQRLERERGQLLEIVDDFAESDPYGCDDDYWCMWCAEHGVDADEVTHMPECLWVKAGALLDTLPAIE